MRGLFRAPWARDLALFLCLTHSLAPALNGWKASKAADVLTRHGFELPRNANPEQISKAFRDWISRTGSHPDKWAGNALKEAEASRRFREVNEALEVWRAHLEASRMAPGIRGASEYAPLKELPALPAPRGS